MSRICANAIARWWYANPRHRAIAHPRCMRWPLASIDLYYGYGLFRPTRTLSMNELARNLLIWVIVAVVLMGVFQSFSQSSVRSDTVRSEEHTSELQSLMRISYAVFCLKKKKKHTTNDLKR